MRIAQRTFPMKLKLWAIFILGIGCFAQAETSSYWLCRKSMEVRTLRIEKTSVSSCLAWYAKVGIDEKVADSKDLSLCITIVEKIRETLQAAGWRCKDISNSRISQ